MPSSLMALKSPGLTMLPGSDLIDSRRPSRCLMVKLKPQRASTRLMSLSQKRSSRFRRNTACSRCCTCRTMSPGSVSGASSASPRMTIFSPCCVPFEMCTSSIFFSCTTLFPRHSSHRSASSIACPVPRHCGHTVCICCNMPGPSWRTVIFMPAPPQDWQVMLAPLLEPVPLQLRQSTFLDMLSFLVVPLYRSSSVTFIGWLTSSPRRGPRRPRLLRPAPPKNDSKMSNGFAPGPPRPSLSASSPYSS
mmetsp:Transcript_1205/g.4273  ORF Transcript_1205/g.4273 Transcript_1205/m.4273 type:complete len:248 (-) Transcript_1205:458-1201(-)